MRTSASKPKKLLVWAAPLTVFALLLAACGDVDDPGDDPADEEEDAAADDTDDGSEDAADEGDEGTDEDDEAQAITEYPHDSLTFIVPFGPGGGTDTLARAFGPFLEEELGVPVVFENIAGAGATIGTAEMYEAEPDGSVIGIPADNALMLAPRLQDDIPYSDYTDFTILMKMPANPMMMVTGADQPYDDLDDVLAAAVERPGELAIANAGALTTPDVTGEKLSLLSGEEFNSVPSTGGGAEARTSVIAGRAEFGIAGASAYAGQIEAGELKAIALFWDERVDLFPDVPTAIEQGLDMTAASQFYLVGPPGMDPEMRQFLSDAFVRAAENPEFVEQVLELGAVPLAIPGEEAEQELADSVEVIEELVPRFQQRDN